MKNIKKFSAVALIGIFMFMLNSCDDDSEIFTISAPTPPALAELGFTDLELDAVNTNNPAITLNWDQASYGKQASINYAIQFASDEAFTNPVTAASITGKSDITLSINEINAAAGNAGLNPFEWAPLYSRVVASIGSQSSESINSNIIQFDVFPYFNYVFNDYYLVGDATAPGWNNNSNNPALFRDQNNSNVFYYTGFWANNGHFKVLQTKGLWQPQWGTRVVTESDELRSIRRLTAELCSTGLVS